MYSEHSGYGGYGGYGGSGCYGDGECWRDEFGAPLPRWKPLEPEKRGRHKNFLSAMDAALGDLTTEHNAFFDSLFDVWRKLFPKMPARPGRYEDGHIFIYVPSAPALYSMRPRMKKIASVLAMLPNAPKKISLKLEIRK